MRIATAQRAESGTSEDKVLTTDNAVIVLDGAAALRAVPVAASLYAEHLGTAMRNQLRAAPHGDLRTLLGTAIAIVAQTLKLEPGAAPSSTVAIARARGDHLDALALGNTALVFPTGILRDDRINQLQLPQRGQSRAHLATGDGDTHEPPQLPQHLRQRHAEHRNRDGGYWIAEADPTAAAHALTKHYPISTNPWAVLATDGAYTPITHRARPPWATVAHSTSAELHTLLHQLDRWEIDNTPHEQHHDDKTLAVTHWTP